MSGKSVTDDVESLQHLDLIDRSLEQVASAVSGAEFHVFVGAVKAHTAQLRGDTVASALHWGDLDALDAQVSESFDQYLCLVEAPIAVHRGDVDRAHALIERALAHLSIPHIVPLGRVDALKIRSALYEQSGDLAAALRDAREATDLVLSETNGLADLLIAQVDERAALEESQQALLDRTTRLSQQALIDELSQVGNRRAYEVQVETLRAGPERRIALLLCDIDGLKLVNDQHGHSMGDHVIAGIGQIASHESDGASQVFRYGGDEFIVLCDSATADRANHLAERIRTAFNSRRWSTNDKTIQVTCSIGVWAGRSRDIEHGVAEADRQMYEAKKSGRDAVRVANRAFS